MDESCILQPSISEGVLDLFGGKRSWAENEWRQIDDRLRGGSSRSHLSVAINSEARFHGNLDIDTLGGAGFASQGSRLSAVGPWNLSRYDGIVVRVAESDDKLYTIVLKDTIGKKNIDTGRIESTTSWEVSLQFRKTAHDIRTSLFNLRMNRQDDKLTAYYIPFERFKPYYRGKPNTDAKPLDLNKVKQISLMMRSHFGKQKGRFSIHLSSISAYDLSLYSKGRFESAMHLAKETARLLNYDYWDSAVDSSQRVEGRLFDNDEYRSSWEESKQRERKKLKDEMAEWEVVENPDEPTMEDEDESNDNGGRCVIA